jgi:predicted Na+-dependent transporter
MSTVQLVLLPTVLGLLLNEWFKKQVWQSGKVMGSRNCDA